MKIHHLIASPLLSLATCIPPAALAAGGSSADVKLEQLAVSEGRWVYHGQMLGEVGSHPTAFVWHADCRRSANRAFMMCSFSNTWGAQHINSLVVDTYNHHDHAFWHYEIFEDGDAPDKPFASKMQIDGPKRIEEWTQSRHGKAIHQRIVYKFASDKKVAVSFQQSEDGKAWRTTAIGTGEKTSR